MEKARVRASVVALGFRAPPCDLLVNSLATKSPDGGAARNHQMLGVGFAGLVV
jgi:hypothetical protein